MSHTRTATIAVDFYSRRGGTELFAYTRGQPIPGATHMPKELVDEQWLSYSGIEWYPIARSDIPDNVGKDHDFDKQWTSNLKNGHRATTRLYDYIHVLVAKHYRDFHLYATTTKDGSPIYVLEDTELDTKALRPQHPGGGSHQLAIWF